MRGLRNLLLGFQEDNRQRGGESNARERQEKGEVVGSAGGTETSAQATKSKEEQWPLYFAWNARRKKKVGA